MAEVTLDANVIVALLYSADSQHLRARDLVARLEADGHVLVLVDFLVFEALSVLCRRAAERKTSPPDLHQAVTAMRAWFDGREVRFLARETERLATTVLELVAASGGELNANDALVVALEREGVIDKSRACSTWWDNDARGSLRRPGQCSLFVLGRAVASTPCARRRVGSTCSRLSSLGQKRPQRRVRHPDRVGDPNVLQRPRLHNAYTVAVLTPSR